SLKGIERGLYVIVAFGFWINNSLKGIESKGQSSYLTLFHLLKTSGRSCIVYMKNAFFVFSLLHQLAS
ncbi:MAG: hypothetical protein QW065_05030, partial [Acidilobaceae archaeon]